MIDGYEDFSLFRCDLKFTKANMSSCRCLLNRYEDEVEMLSPLPDPAVLLSLPQQQQLFSDGFIGLKQDFGRILAHSSL